MDDSGFYDEGLVAAALGERSGENPYREGTGRHRKWREGFVSYGRREDDRLSEALQLEGAESR